MAGCYLQAATATSNILVFMSSSSAALTYLVSGRLITNYAVVYCLVCCVASVVGLTFVKSLVQRTGHPSLVVLLLAFIMGAGGVVSGVFGYLQAWDEWQTGEDFGFQGLC